MDLRIVNTCNNNCLYCLEQWYRFKEPFIDKKKLFDKIRINSSLTNDNILNFYWWNPLLHPDLNELIIYAKSLGYNSIWLLTNTLWLNSFNLDMFISNWLNSIWVYFYSFNLDVHKKIVNWWIDLKKLLFNINLILKSGIYLKFIIHVNKQNLEYLYKDIYILNKKFWIADIEFINYFPFDRPYDLYKDYLSYEISEFRYYIDIFFKIINTLNIKVNFMKFPLDFFWNNLSFYNFYNWVINQISEEDLIRIKSNYLPFCFKENRCKYCFIIDNCSVYLNKKNIF